ncbi:unnamed protein product [Caenorhabditis auriculariae]|uniref:Uncharacterized protein n=1 Tax=Caenorhabditis auriculariae TaxID=2777116 RepID=A0A8S1HIB4_9PELO|nr:unnamed protein product [Caenorhabditis auriculariae]
MGKELVDTEVLEAANDVELVESTKAKLDSSGFFLTSFDVFFFFRRLLRIFLRKASILRNGNESMNWQGGEAGRRRMIRLPYWRPRRRPPQLFPFTFSVARTPNEGQELLFGGVQTEKRSKSPRKRRMSFPIDKEHALLPFLRKSFLERVSENARKTGVLLAGELEVVELDVKVDVDPKLDRDVEGTASNGGTRLVATTMSMTCWRPAGAEILRRSSRDPLDVDAVTPADLRRIDGDLRRVTRSAIAVAIFVAVDGRSSWRCILSLFHSIW